MGKVLTVQDLSCVGKCSLTVALPVLSAMGCACSVLPTAVLSTHTAFPGPHVRDLTEDMAPMADHWKAIGAEFDAILVGYLASPQQAAAVEQLLEQFPAKLVLDPVMGDHGRLYSRITQAHIAALRQLCSKADCLLPNVTEAAFLTGMPYREQPDAAYLQELIRRLQTFGPRVVVITGVVWDSENIGFAGGDENGLFTYRVPRIPRSQHGTGDLFSAVFTGSYVRGAGAEQSAALAAGFVEQVMAGSRESSPFGADFEQHLPWLWQQP